MTHVKRSGGLKQKIIPCLWFDDQAEEAARLYTSIFKNSSIGRVTHYSQSTEAVSGKPAGSVMTVDFELEKQKFVALNGGPQFKFTEAISLMVSCETQEEVDMFWNKLSEGGEEGQCGWLKDKYGVSWQIAPTRLDELLQDEDTEKAERVMAAMLKMKKIDLPTLEQAANQK